ncbi:hypothetical protein [Kushneria indalinina]|uniref:Uncharacterized protein n=1 Tax=Kushneria indalinina DSM 14324 TaxID=1122140 RepID=A0A3D9DX01_9GAMM|nr:hypothetical protein [Kushneria indalinina]REC95310.1 hypothetical protein C8D72_2146 [Kushneria indalinina DSM 14324]
MKASQIASWGLTLALVPMLALASSQPGEDNLSSPSMETSGQNTGGMSRQGGASGMQDQSGSMQGDRQQQLRDSHEASSVTDSTQRQRQKDGAGTMNDDHTLRTEQSTSDIQDQRTQDDTAP